MRTGLLILTSTNANDRRLVYLRSLATLFKSMDTYLLYIKQTKVLELTIDISNALHVTLNEIIKLLPFLLMKSSRS